MQTYIALACILLVFFAVNSVTFPRFIPRNNLFSIFKLPYIMGVVLRLFIVFEECGTVPHVS